VLVKKDLEVTSLQQYHKRIKGQKIKAKNAKD